jgi:hypothetical protein
MKSVHSKNSEFEKYRITQDRLFKSDFEIFLAVQQLNGLSELMR